MNGLALTGAHDVVSATAALCDVDPAECATLASDVLTYGLVGAAVSALGLVWYDAALVVTPAIRPALFASGASGAATFSLLSVSAPPAAATLTAVGVAAIVFVVATMVGTGAAAVGSALALSLTAGFGLVYLGLEALGELFAALAAAIAVAVVCIAGVAIVGIAGMLAVGVQTLTPQKRKKQPHLGDVPPGAKQLTTADPPTPVSATSKVPPSAEAAGGGDRAVLKRGSARSPAVSHDDVVPMGTPAAEADAQADEAPHAPSRLYPSPLIEGNVLVDDEWVAVGTPVEAR